MRTMCGMILAAVVAAGGVPEAVQDDIAAIRRELAR